MSWGQNYFVSTDWQEILPPKMTKNHCETRFIDLVLSKDQKVMNDGEAEGRYCWTADIITDYDLSDEHVSKKFLGYEFKSITCRYKFE